MSTLANLTVLAFVLKSPLFASTGSHVALSRSVSASDAFTLLKYPVWFRRPCCLRGTGSLLPETEFHITADSAVD